MENEFSSDVTRLPPEVWLIIAKELLKTGSNDLENLCNSSVFFQEVLASLRTTYLFEKVFPLVDSSFWKTGGQGLTITEDLQLRGVCKHWNLVIDELVAGKVQSFGEVSKDAEVARVDLGDSIREVMIRNLSFTYSIDDDDESEIRKCIHDFLRHFESSHPGHQPHGRSPFIWGNISVKTWRNEGENEVDYQNFLKGVITMLSKYGSHVLTFTLSCNNVDFSDPENAPMIQKWFSCLPNLKQLTFRCDSDHYWENEDMLIPGWKFPKDQCLEKLKTDNLPGTLFNLLIRQNNHVSTLIVENVVDNYDFVTIPLPKLKILKLGYLSDELVNQLATMQDNWPLENLRIQLVNDYGGCDVLLKAIQDKFSTTLLSLKISMVDREDKDKDEGRHWLGFKNFRLQLPKLTKIILYMKNNKVCLDFLLGMKQNLEEISVEFDYELPRMMNGTLTSGTIVQFMGFGGKMLESNIWMLFRKLKKIEICAIFDKDWETRVYSREEWMLKNEYI